MTTTDAPYRVRRGTLITAVVTAAASTIAPNTATATPSQHESTDPATLVVPMLPATPTITVQGRVTPPATPSSRPTTVTARTRTTPTSATTNKRTGPSAHELHQQHVTHRATQEEKKTKKGQRTRRARSLQTVATQQARSSTTAASAVLSGARANLGIPYVWGGENRAGFDCSGYTQYVFAKAGKRIPRTAEAQRRAATKVNNPRPGDLVFFGHPAHHVGIYAGDGKMYHAPRTGKDTRLSKIWSPNVTYGRF